MRIFHTNDIHSEYENMERLASFLKKYKTSDDLYLDAGDTGDLKSLMVIGSKGVVSATLMNYLKVDAMAVGNNESELGQEWVELITKEMPLLSCNLKTIDGNDLNYLQNSKIITKNDIRFLIIGTSPFYSASLEEGAYNFFLELDGLKSIEPIQAIQQEIEKYQGEYDVCILLSHSGIESDEYIAKSVNGIDIIIGGHSHTQIDDIFKINHTMIVQAKSYAEYIGCLDITFNENKMDQVSYQLIPLDKEEKDQDFIELVNRCNEQAIDQLNEPVAHIEELNYDLVNECHLINFICDALMKLHPCDFAMIYHGIVNHSLKGDVSKMDLIHCSPSKLNPTFVKVMGKQIRDAFELSLDKEYCLQSGKGPGFRGDKLGTLGFSSNVQIKDQKILINGVCLDDQKEYSIMIDDYLQRGARYPSLKTPEKDAKFFRGFIRDLIEDHLNDEECFTSCKIKRGV